MLHSISPKTWMHNSVLMHEQTCTGCKQTSYAYTGVIYLTWVSLNVNIVDGWGDKHEAGSPLHMLVWFCGQECLLEWVSNEKECGHA